MTTPKTTNLSLYLPRFNFSPWHDEVNDNFIILDSVLQSALGAVSLRGLYKNSTAVTTGQRFVDKTTGGFYQAQSDFTTLAPPNTFAQERAAHPTRWALVNAAAAIDASNNAATSASAAAASATAAAASAASLATATGIYLRTDQDGTINGRLTVGGNITATSMTAASMTAQNDEITINDRVVVNNGITVNDRDHLFPIRVVHPSGNETVVSARGIHSDSYCRVGRTTTTPALNRAEYETKSIVYTTSDGQRACSITSYTQADHGGPTDDVLAFDINTTGTNTDTRFVFRGGRVYITDDLTTTGNISIPNLPCFSAQEFGSSLVLHNGLITSPIPFSTILLNSGDNYNSTTGVFTAPVAGFYVFCFHVSYRGAFFVYIYINGSNPNNREGFRSTERSNWHVSSATDIFSLQANDQVSLRILGTVTSDYHGTFCGYKIG